MIVVQDRISVQAGDVPRLRTLLAERYLPAARARGLIFQDSDISPPLDSDHYPCTVSLRWQLADIAAFWIMRGMAGMDPGVAAFWNEVDRFCMKRTREFLRPDAFADAPLQGPRPIDAFLAHPSGWRETAQLHLRPEAGAAERATLEAALAEWTKQPGVLNTHLGRNLMVGHGAGDYSWDVRYASAVAAAEAKHSAHWTQALVPLFERCLVRMDLLALETIGAGTRQPQLTTGIKRTALFRLLPGVGDEAQREFERNTLDMPAYIPEILNWRLSRAQPAAGITAQPGWSYVWEQEYADLEGLNGAYMAHPHHWAFIDASFDVESGRQLIDSQLCHAYCPLERTLLGAELAETNNQKEESR